MKLLKFLFIFLFAAILALVFFHGYVLGMLVEPLVEKFLTDAFDMPVAVDGVRVRLWPGHISIDKLVIYNPKGFLRRDHITAKGMDIYLDPGSLKKKFVHIHKAHIRELTFAIESYTESGKPRTNVKHWYYHMGLDEDDPPIPKEELANPLTLEQAIAKSSAAGYWRVRMERLDLDKGTFVYDDRCVDPPTQLIFQNLNGYWSGFDYVKLYRLHDYTEDIELTGTFGKSPPARFHGKGKCQFADGDNFDIRAEITGGSLQEYQFLLEGLPAEVRGGTFDLRSRMYSLHSDLDSEHVLTLKNIKFAAPTTKQKLLKYPLGGVLLLLQNEQSIELDIRVDGYIGDPRFRFFDAFTQALQKSLFAKTGMVLKGIQEGTKKLAIEAPVQMIGTVGDVLMSPFANGADRDAGKNT